MTGSRIQSNQRRSRPDKRASSYPKTSATGGILIREVVATLKKAQFKFINSHILIALSSGIDSMALAHLLIHYGRKVASKNQIRSLHINHGWRGEESDGDEQFLVQTAKGWGVPLEIIRLKPPRGPRSESLENEARLQRKEIFQKVAKKHGAKIFTAHHADDLAETLLWKLCTGQDSSQWGGILVQDQFEFRPFLRVRKRLLKLYLEQEGQAWREDSTNQDPRFLRAQMRKELLPILEKVFPKSMDHLAALGYALQGDETSWEKFWGMQRSAGDLEVFHSIFQALGVRSRKPHYQVLKEKLQQAHWLGRIDLPQGWILTAEKKNRWVLTRSP